MTTKRNPAPKTIPTPIFKECVRSLRPVITKIVNLLVSQDVIPVDLRKVLIMPLLKKAGLDIEILKPFHLVSNLIYIAKLIERLVGQHLLKHL